MPVAQFYSQPTPPVAPLRLVSTKPAPNLGDLLHRLARRPRGTIYIAAITQWVTYLLRVLPPEA